ncbi:FxsC protein [Catellatospora chokoriensis]|uniref:Effector-associated domain-containing protein n=1 Tax=Catellatospora chokoriensis TaxID=310353 RepID=A0A8J3K073_9ACTN|nr:FxsC protein [Catellatospora chokoriensis]GIF90263.1 hypothetical protein Cch02nite_37070 [Catellatospora chokoriensis]
MRTWPQAPAAVESLIAARQKLSLPVMDLACHAAVAVALDAGFVHLLRINFFLDTPVPLTYECEADLLLSPLVNELGDGLYEIDPQARRLLLHGLLAQHGTRRLREVALLLERYTLTHPTWRHLPELSHAQRLTVLNIIDPHRAAGWLAEAAAVGEAGTEELAREWFVVMQRQIHDDSQTQAADGVAEAVTALSSPVDADRIAAVHQLGVLALVPGNDLDSICEALYATIADRTAGPVARVVLDSLGSLLPTRRRTMPAGSEPAPKVRMPVTVVNAMVDSMLAMALHNTAAWTACIELVEGELGPLGVSRNDAPRLDFFRVVRACERLPDGVEVLLSAMSLVLPTPSELTALYQRYAEWQLTELLVAVPFDSVHDAAAAITGSVLAGDSVSAVLQEVGWQIAPAWGVPGLLALADLVGEGGDTPPGHFDPWLNFIGPPLGVSTEQLERLRLATTAFRQTWLVDSAAAHGSNGSSQSLETTSALSDPDQSNFHRNYYFFLSFSGSRATGGDHWIRLFYRELSHEVRSLATTSNDMNVGFADFGASGHEGDNSVRQALDGSRVLVQLYSPEYMDRSSARLQRAQFLQRVFHSVPDDIPHRLQPVLWLPMGASEHVSDLSRALELGWDIPEYARLGLETMRRLSTHRGSYELILSRLARRIVDAAERRAVAQDLPLPPSGMATADSPDTPFVIAVIAPTEASLPSSRHTAPYGLRSAMWRPYRSAHELSVAEYAAGIARSFRMPVRIVDFAVGDHLIETSPGVILVDPWILARPDGRSMFQTVTSIVNTSMSVLIVIDHTDPQYAPRGAELAREAMAALAGTHHQLAREAREFEHLISRMVVRNRRQFLSARRPPDDSPTRPHLTEAEAPPLPEDELEH